MGFECWKTYFDKDKNSSLSDDISNNKSVNDNKLNDIPTAINLSVTFDNNKFKREYENSKNLEAEIEQSLYDCIKDYSTQNIKDKFVCKRPDRSLNNSYYSNLTKMEFLNAFNKSKLSEYGYTYYLEHYSSSQKASECSHVSEISLNNHNNIIAFKADVYTKKN